MVTTNGIDTTSLVSSLIAVERLPQDNLKTRVSQLQQTQSAWTQIGGKLTALKTAADALAGSGSTATPFAVSSDDSSSVSAQLVGTLTAPFSSTVEVTNLAAAHSVLVNDSFAGTTSSTAGRSLDLTIGGTTTTLTSADGTIGGLATAINNANLGINAQVLQTQPGSYQLALTATKSGAASVFTVAGTGWTSPSVSTVQRAGADADFKVDGVAMKRASNVINDVIPGVELTLKAKTTSPVGVSATQDANSIVSKVKALVDAANGVLTMVNAATNASADAGSRGPLSGDYAARQVGDSIRNFVAQGFTSSDGKTIPSSQLGVSLDKTGAITFDETALRATLTSDPNAVMSVLGRTATSTVAGVKVTNVSAAATTGPRTIAVTKVAAAASMVGALVPAPPAGSVVSLTVVTPSGPISVTFTAGADFAETAARMNAALRGAGVKASADVDTSGGLRLTSDQFGSAASLEVTGAGAATLGLPSGPVTGEDAQLTIDGKAYTASGKNLVRDGLAFSVDTTQAQLDAAGGVSISGTVTVNQGFAGGLSALADQGNNSTSGVVTSANNSINDQIKDLQSRISRWDDVLSQRQTTLTARFTAMQNMLTKLNAMGTSLGITGTSTTTTA